MLAAERELWSQGIRRVGGIDEAGRGPLAGPVVAAAVVFVPEFAEREAAGLLSGLTDSKQLSRQARETFYALLTASPDIDVGSAVVESDEIDRINILQATHVAMARAVAALPVAPEHLLVDGLAVEGLGIPADFLVKGDARSLSIAAASVVAKVTRDALMRQYDQVYPGYGFAIHKGYGTTAHMRALMQLGPCPIHRRSFRPVRDCAELRKSNSWESSDSSGG